MRCKPASTPIEINENLWFDGNHILNDLGRYKRLIEKLIDQTLTMTDITFAVEVLSRFMHQLKKVHWIVALRILVHVKSSPEKSLVYRKNGHVRFFWYSNFGYASEKGIRNLPLDIALYWRKPCDLDEQETCGISI